MANCLWIRHPLAISSRLLNPEGAHGHGHPGPIAAGRRRLSAVTTLLFDPLLNGVETVHTTRYGCLSNQKKKLGS